jgi:hypothetical protein
MGINFIVLGFAAMNRFHIEGMPKHKGNPFLLTEVGEPVPREDTLYSHDQIVPIGGDDPQERFRGGREILVDEFRAVLIQDTDVHRLGM